MLMAIQCGVAETGNRNWAYFLYTMEAFQMLPGIQLQDEQPGPAVPPINHPGPAPPNAQGGVVANYMRQLDLYN